MNRCQCDICQGKAEADFDFPLLPYILHDRRVPAGAFRLWCFILAAPGHDKDTFWTEAKGIFSEDELRRYIKILVQANWLYVRGDRFAVLDGRRHEKA